MDKSTYRKHRPRGPMLWKLYNYFSYYRIERLKEILEENKSWFMPVPTGLPNHLLNVLWHSWFDTLRKDIQCEKLLPFEQLLWSYIFLKLVTFKYLWDHVLAPVIIHKVRLITDFSQLTGMYKTCKSPANTQYISTLV